MNYAEAMDYVKKSSGSGIRPGLERISSLLELLGNPQEKKPVIHVAGTNGKGSVCTYIASILNKAGYRTGRYISPPVFGYREIIQTDGKWISEQAAADCVSRVKEAAMKDDGLRNDPPTSFEIETAMAYLYLAESDTDILVIETGMGGRLDATNVVKHPLASVITSISLDHMRFLGTDTRSIAREKGGIIKEGRPAIVCGDDPAALGSLTAICRERDAQCFIVKTSDIRDSCLDLTGDLPVRTFSYRGLSLKTYMAGSYEPLNAALAIRTCQEAGLDINKQALIEGISSARWPGRFEIIRKDIPVLIDGAHNPAGARALVRSAREYLGEKKIILMMAVFADKSYDEILSIMSDLSDTIIVFRSKSPRGLDLDQLSQAAGRHFCHVFPAGSYARAVELAKQLAAEHKAAVLQFGTLSVISDMEDLWKEDKYL